MIKRILYPTDFSSHAEKCVDYILRMKECGIEEVVLLHVIDDHIIKYTDEMFEESVDEEKIVNNCQKNSRERMAKLAKRFQDAGIKTRTLIRLGIPFSTILKTADEVDASMVVLGHRGHNLAEELLLGSVAEKVARKSKRPVLLIR